MNDQSKIDSLVPDIYEVLDKGVDPAKTAEILDSELPKLRELLIERLSPREIVKQPLRMSQAGVGCLRKLWYQRHEPEKAEKLQPWVLNKFMYGHLVEWWTLLLVKLTGKHEVTGEQDELELAGVKGHRDAVIDGRTVDVKSASGRGFDKFKYNGVPKADAFGYMDQLSLYTTAADDAEKERASFLAVDKEMGHIVLDTYDIEAKDWEAELRAKQEVIENAGEVPERAHKPVPHQGSGNEQLALECRYCPFKSHCWGDSLRTFVYGSGPVFLTTVKREPNVPEIK